MKKRLRNTVIETPVWVEGMIIYGAVGVFRIVLFWGLKRYI